LIDNSQPFISVIVPVFNNADGIAILLNALESQTYGVSHYEVVVIDNGSQDETLEVVTRFASHSESTIVILQESHRGSYAARNKGLSESRGEILAFTDSDCIPTESWLMDGVSGLLETNADGAGGRIEFTYESGTPNVYEYLDSANKLDQKSYVEDVGFAATANFVVRRSAIDKLGPFLSDLESGGDYEFGVRFERHGLSLTYLEDATVMHPARSSFGSIIKKNMRVARGQRGLQDKGLWSGALPGVKLLMPPRKLPAHSQFPVPSGLNRIRMIGTIILGRYVNFLIRRTPWKGW